MQKSKTVSLRQTTIPIGRKKFSLLLRFVKSWVAFVFFSYKKQSHYPKSLTTLLWKSNVLSSFTTMQKPLHKRLPGLLYRRWQTCFNVDAMPVILFQNKTFVPIFSITFSRNVKLLTTKQKL